MPDILLIQPPIRDFYLTAKRTIPYGLASIAAVLRQDGFSVEIFDALATPKSRPLPLPLEMDYLTGFYGQPDISPFGLFHGFHHFGYSLEHIGKMAKESGAFLVGISSLFTAYSNEALETARIVKKFHPACKIVLGGHHPTALPEAVMACDAVDFVIRGEGETALSALAHALETGKSVENVPGIVFRKPDGSLYMAEPAVMAHLDDWPLPALDLVNHRFYRRKQGGSAVIMSSRGCPMTCSYCSVGRYSPLGYRRRSVDSVLREIETAVTCYDARFIDFEDENLSLDKNWFLELLAGIRERFGKTGLELRAMNGLFAPSLDAEVIRAMQMSGFRTLNLSLGSTHADQLKRFRRPDVRDAVENAMKLAHDCGMDSVCYLIVAAPDQRPEKSVDDLLYLAAQPALAGVSVYYPAPGSADYDRAEAMGLLPENYSLMRSSALPLSHTTTRRDAVTLLRLGRILNFMKALQQENAGIPEPAPLDGNILSSEHGRTENGRRLLAAFFHDGKIRGVAASGHVFEHPVSSGLCRHFIAGLKQIRQIAPD